MGKKQAINNTKPKTKQTKAEKVAQSKLVDNIQSGSLAISNGKYIEGLKQQQLKRAASRPPAATLPILMIIRLINYMLDVDNKELPLTKIGIISATVGTYATAEPYINGDRDYIVINKQQYHKTNDIKELQRLLINDNDIIALVDDYVGIRGYIRAYKDILISSDNNTPFIISDALQLQLNELNYYYSCEYNINFSSILIKALCKLQEQRETDLYNKGRVTDIFIHKSQYGWTDGPTAAASTTNNTINISGPQSSEFLKLLGYTKN